MKKKVIIQVMFWFSIIFLILVCYLKFFSKKQNIQPFGVTMLKVSSNSMRPEFEKGDIIFIKKQENYEIGDIITYQTKDNNLVTHRVIEKYGNDYITKGDSNNIEDEEKIKPEQIKGKLIIKIKKLLEL